MKDCIIYIAEASLFLSIFFLIYILFLRSATFLRFNRIYLLAGLIVPFFLPMIEFTYDVPVFYSAFNVPVSHDTVITDVSANRTDYVWIVLSLLYLSGVVALTVHNILECRKIHKLIKTGKLTRSNNYIVVDNEKIISPFSFLRYILLNTRNLSNTEQELILKHEITHVAQKHWFDLFCSQCALVLQWFNPLAWLYISSLKENHEFLADRAVLDTGCSPALYRAVLINQRFQGPVFSFANSFNYSNHLKRLTMMKKMKSSPWKRLAVVALIPAMGLFFWVSAKPNYVAQSAEMQAKANQSGNVLTTGEYTRDSVKISINDSGINNSGKQPLYVVDGKEVSHSQFNKIRRNTIESVSVLRDSSATNLYGEKGKNGAVLITTKKSKAIDLNTLPPEKRPLFIIDGKEVPYSQFKKIHPSTIDSMSVIKYKNATELYGEKGKNGVIIIVSKKK